MQRKLIKNLLLVLTLVVLCLAVGMTASAETWGDYEYIVLEDGTVELTYRYGKGDNSGTRIEVPSEIEGRTVTRIGINFGKSFDIGYLYIPDTITYINPGAAFGCSYIDVDENNKYYSSDEDGTLFNKDKTVLIQHPVQNGKTSYTVPETVKIIGEYAFGADIFLEEIILPEGLLHIQEGAFGQCLALKELILPDSLESMDAYSLGECMSLRELTLPKNIKTIDETAIAACISLDKIYIESMDAELGSLSINAHIIDVIGVSLEEFISLYKECYYRHGDNFNNEELYIEFIKDCEDQSHGSTIYCHAGSTSETYAKENGMKYVTVHFFDDEWTYDYDNMIRYRKCIHCYELETEQLETTGDSDVEIIEPVDPDTDFIVDEITDYVIIEEALSNGVVGDFEIVKAFDINLKNKDGVHVQPDGTVKVKLPLDWSKDGVYKVYRVNDDGTLTDMNAYREGSHMVFDTDHFSIYVIVDESGKTDAPATPDEPQEETKDNFFLKIIDFIKAFFDLIASMFKR